MSETSVTGECKCQVTNLPNKERKKPINKMTVTLRLIKISTTSTELDFELHPPSAHRTCARTISQQRDNRCTSHFLNIPLLIPLTSTTAALLEKTHCQISLINEGLSKTGGGCGRRFPVATDAAPLFRFVK